MMQPKSKKSSSRRFQGGNGRSASDRFEVPSYSGPMESLLDIIRFGPAILGVPRTLVLLFVAERTVAYRKLADASSLAQIVEGVYRKQGAAVQWIRMGCGLKHSAAVQATASLVEMGLLEKRKRGDAKRGNLPTQYEIRWDALHSYLIEKSNMSLPPLIRSAEKGSFKPLPTDLSEAPLSAQRTSPCPPGGQEQYLDNNSAGKPILVSMVGFDRRPLNESNTSKADYSFASAKNAEGSEHHRWLPQARNLNPIPAHSDMGQVHGVLVETSVENQAQSATSISGPLPVEAPIAAQSRPWTACELQAVYACGSAYMEDDTPPDNFASNCELAAVGHSAAEVIECLNWRFAKKRYRPGGRYGPRVWNWFYTVIRESFSATERGHLPEPTRRRQPYRAALPRD